MNVRHVLVESTAAYEAMDSLRGDEVVWHTASPFLLERLCRQGPRVESLEAGIAQEELNALGEPALRIAKAWGRRLDSIEAATLARLSIGAAVLPQLKLLIVPLLVRAILADRWATRVVSTAEKPSVVGSPELSSPTPWSMKFANSDTLYFHVLKRSPWASCVEFVASEPRRTGGPADAARRSRSDCWWTMSSASASKFCYVLWRRYASGKPWKLPWADAGTEVGLFGNNELIKEAFLPLLVRGATVRELRMPPAAATVSDGWVLGANEREVLRGDLQSILLDLAVDWKLPSLAGAASLGAERMLAFLDVFLPYVRAARQSPPLNASARRRRRVALSHGLTDPVERLFHQLVHETRTPIIEVEHGGAAGLSHAHSGSVELAGMNACDASIVYNENFARYYAAHLGQRMPPTFVAGAPSYVRSRGSRMSRGLARRSIGATPRERVVMYVTNMFFGNGLTMPYIHLDTHYYAFQRRIVCEGLAASPDRCFVKLYPSASRLDPDPLTACADLPPNVALITRGDFRYLRYAADIIVIDVPLSTLGWALGADVPTILLDLPFNPLLPDAAGLADEAVFRIDCTADDWMTGLRDLLTAPASALDRRWEQKRRSRHEFVERYVLGPGGLPGRRVADVAVSFDPHTTITHD